MKKLLNKLRTKAWYWDVLCFLWCTLLFIGFMIYCAQDIKGQEVKAYHYAPGVIGMSALPSTFIITNINHNNFTHQFGSVEPYMNNNKLHAYNKMMNNNNTILITGALVTVTGLVIQYFVSKKFDKKRKRKNYCNY